MVKHTQLVTASLIIIRQHLLAELMTLLIVLGAR